TFGVPTTESMNVTRRKLVWVLTILCCVASAVYAQRMRQRGRSADPNSYSSDRSRGPSSRAGVPEWSVDPRFRHDVFTFVRLRYTSRYRGGWRVDYPAADLNLSYRLEQLTSMRVDPEGLVLDIDDPRLFDYPFAFMIDPRSLSLTT